MHLPVDGLLRLQPHDKFVGGTVGQLRNHARHGVELDPHLQKEQDTFDRCLISVAPPHVYRPHVRRETGHTHKHTTRTTQHMTRQNNTTNDHTKNHPPALNNDRRWRGDGAYHHRPRVNTNTRPVSLECATLPLFLFKSYTQFVSNETQKCESSS